MVSQLPDGRTEPREKTEKIFSSLFLGAACQMPSVHRIEDECREGSLRKRIGKLSEDAMRYWLLRQNPESHLGMLCKVSRRLKRNGMLRSTWSRGRVVVGVDGIEICSSFARHCEDCLLTLQSIPR